MTIDRTRSILKPGAVKNIITGNITNCHTEKSGLRIVG
jgi:nucleoside diphosphate kinase